MRNLFFTCMLLISANVLAQPEVRVYYNPFEWVGVAGGYSVNRWRFEMSGSWHQQKVTGLFESSYFDDDTGEYLGPVFESDVWTLKTTTTTVRVLRSGKKLRPWFGPYYGFHLRWVAERNTLTEPHWGPWEDDAANEYPALTEFRVDEICLGFLLGARGTIVQNFFWDVNLALLPYSRDSGSGYYSDGSSYNEGSLSYSSFTYWDYDIGHLLQIGIGYKFGPSKSE